MNPDNKDKDENSGAEKQPGKDEQGIGKDEKRGSDAKEEEPADELQKNYDLYMKDGRSGGGGTFMSKENGKKWMRAAGLLDDEEEFDKAFDKQQESKTVDLPGFRKLVDELCKEKKKEPKEFFDKLAAVGPPNAKAGPS